MIPVIVATHTDGVVRIYYRQPDGTLDQTGRFLATTAIDPPDLAALVADLGDMLHWNGTPEPAKPVTSPPAISAGSGKTTAKKPDHRKQTRAGTAEMQARRDRVLAWLTDHGEVTAPEAQAALFPDVAYNGEARKLLDQLVARGLAVKTPGRHHNDPGRFRARASQAGP